MFLVSTVLTDGHVTCIGNPRTMQDKKFKFFTEPYAHQREAFDKSSEQTTYALLMDMGTGKTKVTIDTIGLLFEEKKIDIAVVVAPKGVIANWVAEIETHLPPRIEREVLLWNPNLTDKVKKSLRALYTKTGKLKFLLMNVEAFSTEKVLTLQRPLSKCLRRSWWLMKVRLSKTVEPSGQLRYVQWAVVRGTGGF